MTFLFGTAIAGSLCFLLLLSGYCVAGFMPNESRLTRLAMANLTGLAWLLLATSVMGALVPLSGAIVWLIWIPVLLVWLMPTTRIQLSSDLRAMARSSHFYAAVVGLALLWLALLLPYLIYPDLAFFDGKTNHDNFFWCIGAEYLQSHNYLTLPEQNRDFPLYNIIQAFIGWNPVWGRVGSEAFIAASASTFNQPAISLYNFLASSLAVPWLLTVLAIARPLGLPTLNRWWLGLVCFCQPVLFFFIANGNLPNLLGTLFSGGLWLLLLLNIERQTLQWPTVVAGIFMVHGVLGCYPEIMAFALVPIGLLVTWRIFQATPGRAKPLLLLLIILIGGACLNPLTTTRMCSGMLNSINQVRQDEKWANVFSRLTFAGYVPSLITLAMPSVRLVGLVGGLLASVAVLISGGLVFKESPRRVVLLISLSGFAVLIIYTVVSSFSYGWQKSAQFFGIPLAVLFPVLLTGRFQDSLRASRPFRLTQIALGSALAVVLLGTVGNTVENLKSAGSKGLTGPLLTLRDRVATEFPGQPIYVDGATFNAGFFHSMWAAKLFARNPLHFLPRQEQAGGYLRDNITLSPFDFSAPAKLYYVATDWARAFDYQPIPLVADRVGVILKEHNLITDFNGFYRPSGVPTKANGEISITVVPYADGWLEFTLSPNGPPTGECKLQGSATTADGEQLLTTTLDAQQQLVVRFPLKGGKRNVLMAQITGAPALDPEHDDPPYPFRVIKVRSARSP